jgi:4-hydroxy-tetrahydrodipicolinate synthase
MLTGCFTALVTPLREDGSIDNAGLERLIEFQLSQGVAGLLAVGTTGESPTLVWAEHNDVIERTCRLAAGRCQAIAGTGSNSTRETLDATAHAAHAGADAVLLVDPYYNGPSSLEIRREYVEPVAREFPQLQIIPYIIPGRTGTMMKPEDLALAHAACPNVCAVKEATGDLDNMARTRQLCGPQFAILSGDDDRTFTMMEDERIRASGVISVMSNVIPAAIQRLTELLAAGDFAAARAWAAKLQPMLGIVAVSTREDSPLGPVQCRARNPLPVKTLMRVLGIPAGPCRRPLGKMTRAGLQKVIDAARAVHASDPQILAPLGGFFGVDVEARLSAPTDAIERLTYAAY